MKPECQIQMAHDILWPIVSREVDFGYPPGVIQAAHGALDVLCWVLDHDHEANEEGFAKNLKMILSEAERRGYRLTELKQQ